MRTICATAGFFKLAAQLGVRVAGCSGDRLRPDEFLSPDTAVIGNLVWGDLEFGKKGDGVGRKSFVSKIVSRQITKIISIAPLLNREDTGVCGHLYSLALGSVDNTLRFEELRRNGSPWPCRKFTPCPCSATAWRSTSPTRCIGQYEGGARGLLHYSTVLNQLWFSRDPGGAGHPGHQGTRPRTADT